MSKLHTGKVFLAGAGPGDPELITLKLLRILSIAEVIIVDRLVNPDIIKKYAHPAALVVFAGKQGYNETSIAQEETTSNIIEYALAGKTVLRLKGGDVAIFSNVLDELMALHEYKIVFEIIPGITASSGASAFAGIPLTARGYSKAVQFISFNQNTYFSREKWNYLATTSDTLVFYMAGKNHAALIELLLRFSKEPGIPVAIIEQATTVHQKVHISTLKNCVRDFAGVIFSSPSLVIVGKVVALHHLFKWFEGGEAGSVFNELQENKNVTHAH